AIDVLHGGDLRIASEAAQGDHVGRGVVLEDLARLDDESVDRLGGVLRRVILADGMQRGDVEGLRVSVIDVIAEVVAAEDDDEAVLPHRLDKDLDAGDLDGLHLLAHGDAAFGAGPAGTAIGDESLVVDGAEIAPDGDVAWPDLEVDAEGLEY